MLLGIVKKSSNMTIDFGLKRQCANADVAPKQALYEAAIIRYRPSMMTTMAALMGTSPIALASGMGADSRRPLSPCVARGVVFSQLLGDCIAPVIDRCLDPLGGSFSSKQLVNTVDRCL
jgi:HAE1 family hydrophobic/amphiphilic exporter-1